MKRALELARDAADRGEVPVGALILNPDGEIISEAANAPIAQHDPTAHAEVVAIRKACEAVGNYRLPGHTLIVTLEPCTMCASAVANARVETLIYGASDPKGGAVESGVRFFDQPTCHHRPSVLSGVMAEDSAALLKSFFKARRK